MITLNFWGRKTTYYDILDIPHNATKEEIRNAYRKLAKMLHPDVSTEHNAEERFKILNEAYHVLSNPEMRSAYDARIHAHETDESEHMSYTGYRGTKYQDPSTWYDPYVHNKYNHTPEPDEPIPNNSPSEQSSRKKTRILNFFLYILFYATLCMAVFLLVTVIIIPASENITTQNAIEAYQDGNRWMDEWEYQKAIESYTKTITLREDFTEAWRAKGYTELAKGVELQPVHPELARKSYLAAIESFGTAIRYDMEENHPDLDTVKSLGNVYERLEMWKEAEAIYLMAKKATPDDPEVNERLQLIQMYLLGFSKSPSTMPTVAIRSRTTR